MARDCGRRRLTGVGGKQILLEDPSGNPVELFEPHLEEAKLDTG